jgi:photosystem II stability/assembly factor-like uncharacterized protein
LFSFTINCSNNNFGSLILSLLDNTITSGVTISVNNQYRDLVYIKTEGLYSTNLNYGDIVTLFFNSDPTSYNKRVDIIRRDYTTDDQVGDSGIRDTLVGSGSSFDITGLTYTFTATPLDIDYNFEYRLYFSANNLPTPTPTTTPTATPTPTPTTSPTPTPTSTPTATPIPLPQEGKYVLAANDNTGLYVSSDSGTTFTLITSSTGRTWNGVSMSQSGQYMLATNFNEKILKSSNYGVTWSEPTYINSGFPGRKANFTSAFVSKDGRYQIVGTYSEGSYYTGGTMWVSSDYGASFTWKIDVDHNSVYDNAVVCSNGSLAPYAAFTTYSSGPAYGIIYNDGGSFSLYPPYGIWGDADTSSDGNTWVAINSPSIYGKGVWVGPSVGWSSYINTNTGNYNDRPRISVSSNISVMLVSAYNQNVYLSTDSGYTFNPISSLGIKAYEDIAISSNGTFMYVAVSGGGNLYKSSNGGSTWSTISSVGTGEWKRIATNK